LETTMEFTWPQFKGGAKGWTAITVEADGALCAVSVRLVAGHRPQLVKCAHCAASRPAAEALAELAHAVGVAGFPWVVSLQRGQYQLLVLNEPTVLAAEMEQSLRWALGAIIDYPASEAHLTWIKIPNAELQPKRNRQLYVIVARHALIAAQQALFHQCKVKLQAMDVRETGQRNIAALLEKKGEGLGLVSLAPEGVSITFTYAGELYLDRFIEQPLAELLGTDEAAQQLVFERIALQISRSIDFIGRNFPFMRVQRMVLAPLPQPMALRDYLETHLALPVEQLDLSTVFDFSLTPALLAPEKQWLYFFALGAALRGGGSMP
jgi:MSHA biogenesis protein MshI